MPTISHSFEHPAPDVILASIEPPPAPVLTPEQEAATFSLAPGFRIELVASEPLVVDPVAMDWDEKGRLYVVEMRGFMPNLEGDGEERATGRIVVLEDDDHDGRMDRSTLFLDELVLPRAVAVHPEGIFIGVPPDLLLCRDRNHNLRCEADEQERVADYGAEPGNVEHRENGLLLGVDGWIYNAKSDRRFRWDTKAERLEVGQTLFRGQWGIAQDDEGLLYSNHNSAFLFADTFPGENSLHAPTIAARPIKEGLNQPLARDEKVHGIRVAPGLNRAYQPGSLRRDGRQSIPTAVSGIAIMRGDQFGPEFAGDAFVPEAAGSAIAHFDLEWRGTDRVAEHALYPDPTFGKREFLAGTDERFRPVDLRVGPDGALWVIDMYRGVIQHAEYVSDHLREYVEAQNLESPGATGRIWRIVREDHPIDYAPPPLGTPEDWIRALDAPNAWARDQASRHLASAPTPETEAALRRFQDRSLPGRLTSLQTLAQRGALDEDLWASAVADPAPAVRRLALQRLESLPAAARPRSLAPVVAALEDPDARVRLAAVHALGALSRLDPPSAALTSAARVKLLEAGRSGDALFRQAALSGLGGQELAALEAELARYAARSPRALDENPRAWLEELAASAYYAGALHVDASSENADLAEASTAAPGVATLALLDRVADFEQGHPIRAALLRGIQAAQTLPGYERVVLARAPRLFSPAEGEADPGDLAQRIRTGFTWPGDPSPGGARPLTAAEEQRRLAGAALFEDTCANCHGRNGRGLEGLAPPLVGSSWVRDADEWLARIILHGLYGPIRVAGQEWNLRMPGHGHDPRFDDETLAGLMTHLRRSWGHGDAPVSPEIVARLREATASRTQAWTAEELEALPIEYRLDRFTGAYRVPIVGIELHVERRKGQLAVGRKTGDRSPLRELREGVFEGEGMQITFEARPGEPVDSARVRFGADEVSVSRVDP